MNGLSIDHSINFAIGLETSTYNYDSRTAVGVEGVFTRLPYVAIYADHRLLMGIISDGVMLGAGITGGMAKVEDWVVHLGLRWQLGYVFQSIYHPVVFPHVSYRGLVLDPFRGKMVEHIIGIGISVSFLTYVKGPFMPG